MQNTKHIISIGGGGFSHSKSDLKLEKYLLSQVAPSSPKICMLPQASRESPEYIVKFYDTFHTLGAKPTWISLFDRVEDSWQEKLLSQDIIYVGGGNTKSMLALWKTWGMDTLLKEAYNRGIVLAGVSAGAICWFEQCMTDSVWPLGVLDGLGFLKNSCCPHYDSEPERAPAYQNNISSGAIKPGIALQDFTAAHYVDETLTKIISSVKNGKAFQVNADSAIALNVHYL